MISTRLARGAWAALATALALGAAPTGARAACQMIVQAELDVRFSANRPLVEASINGKPAWLEVDTGAFSSMIFAPAAAALGLQPYDTGMMVVGVGGESRLMRAKVADFALQKARVKDFEINVGGGNNIRGVVGGDERRVIGLLGRDFLGLLDVEFDLQHGKMRLLSWRDCGARALSYWDAEAPFVTMERTGGYKQAPFDFPVKLNGYLVHATLDSGAGLTVVTPAVAAHAGVGSEDYSKTTGRSAGIGGKTVETHTATFTNIELGEEKIAKAELQVAQLTRGEAGQTGSRVGGGDDLPMLLGADFLHSHRVLIANSQGRIYFSYNGGPVFHHVTSDRPQPPAVSAQPAPAGQPQQ